MLAPLAGRIYDPAPQQNAFPLGRRNPLHSEQRTVAAWQATFEFVPQSSWPADYRTAFDAILPRGRSWADDLEIWGVEDGNRIDVAQDPDGYALFRIDLRSDPAKFLAQIVAFSAANACRLRDEYGVEHEPVWGDMVLALKGSRAFRFVENPELYLRRISVGGLEDA